MSDLRDRMIAVNQPCFLTIEPDGQQVDFSDLPGLIIDKALAELERTHVIVELFDEKAGKLLRCEWEMDFCSYE